MHLDQKSSKCTICKSVNGFMISFISLQQDSDQKTTRLASKRVFGKISGGKWVNQKTTKRDLVICFHEINEISPDCFALQSVFWSHAFFASCKILISVYWVVWNSHVQRTCRHIEVAYKCTSGPRERHVSTESVSVPKTVRKHT